MTDQFWIYVRYAVLFTAVSITAVQHAIKAQQMEQAERANALADAQLHYPKLDIPEGRISIGR
jgi:hypothetical protein